MKRIISNPWNLVYLSLCLFLLAPSCAVNPVTGKKEISLISESQEIQMGKEYDPQIVAGFGLYEDEKMQKFINEKGQEMAKVSHRPHLNYEFKILDSPVVNAFAVPGGYVYFTRGIMAHFNNEAEFAGVLGHEIGHITARHTVKQQTKQTLAQLGFIVGVIASEEFRNYADVAQAGMSLMFLKFSRNHESESDRLGVEYSTKIGYDAKEMANFFNTLARMRGDGGQSIPTFMSTHPDPADRYNKVGQLAQKWQASDPRTSYDINRDRYLQMIDGLVYGEDPRQGYVENNVFYHPTMKFQYPIPATWKTANSPQQVQMAPENGKALMVLRLAQQANLQAAAQTFITENKLTQLSSRNVKVNGLNAVAVDAEQPAQQDQNGQQTQALRVLTYFIQYNGTIYQLLGVTASVDFSTYSSLFRSTMTGFRQLTDPSKINVKPERIKVIRVNQSTTLKSILQSQGIAADRLEEMAVLNSMQLTDQVGSGTYLKVLTRY